MPRLSKVYEDHEALTVPTVTFATDGCVMASWRNVAVAVWGIPSSLSLIGELRKLMDLVSNEHVGITVIHIALGAVPLPAKEIRAAFSALADDFRPKVARTAVLVGDKGFWASAVRSFMTSFVLNKGPMQLNLCGSVNEAVSWIARNQDVGAGHFADAELKQAVQWVLDRPELRGLGRNASE